MRFVATAIVIGAAAALALSGPVPAQTPYPSRPIEFVIPFAAGGSADVLARLVAQAASETLGQTLIIDNRTGATGAIASEYVARAPADGYVILMATGSTHTVLPAYRNDLSYDTLKDFEPVTQLGSVPVVLAANPKRVQARTIAELIAYLKFHPATVTFGTSGVGSSGHFAGELFAISTDTRLVHVPYRGNGPALNDVVAGNIDMIVDNLSAVLPQMEQGSVVALGVGSPERTPLAPSIPAIAETVPGYNAVSWAGIVAPRNTPKPIVDKLAQAFRDAVARPDISQRLRDIGWAPATQTPEQFGAFLVEDLNRWKRVASSIHISADTNK